MKLKWKRYRNNKIDVFLGEGGGKNMVGTYFLVKEDYPSLVPMMEF